MGVHHDEDIYQLLKTRSKNFHIGLMEQRVMFQTIIPVWEMEDGKLKSLKLFPVEAKMKGQKNEVGLPFPAEDDDIFNRLSKMSKPYGVEMKKKGKFIECSW